MPKTASKSRRKKLRTTRISAENMRNNHSFLDIGIAWRVMAVFIALIAICTPVASAQDDLPDGITVTSNGDGTATMHIGADVSIDYSNNVFDIDSVSAFDVDASNSTYSSIDGLLYDRLGTTLYRCPVGMSGNITVGMAVTTISSGAFDDCGQIDTLFFNATQCSNVGDDNNGNISNNGTHINVMRVGYSVEKLLTMAQICGLKYFSVDPYNYHFFSRDGLLVNESGNTLMACPRAWQGVLNLPEGVTHIFQNACKNCTMLTAVEGLENVTCVDAYAFYGCTGLSTLTIPASVDTICQQAFASCGIETLYFNAIQAKAYHSVYYQQSNTTDYYTNNGYNIFKSTYLRTVFFGDQVTTIPEYAFRGCSALTSAELPPALVSIGKYAFSECPLQHTMTIPSTVNRIGENAFYNCSALKHVRYNAETITSGIFDTLLRSTYSGTTWYYNIVNASTVSQIFGGTTHVTRLDVGEGVRTMGAIWIQNVDTLSLPTTLDTVIGIQATGQLRHLYFNCKDLRVVWEYTDGYTGIRDDGIRTTSGTIYNTACELFNSTLLQHVIFGDSVHTIPSYAFGGCQGVQEFVHLRLPETVTAIGSYAFENCVQILSAEIPQTVTRMGACPFVGCKYMRKLEFNADAQYYGDIVLPNADYYRVSHSLLTYDNVAPYVPAGGWGTATLRDVIPPIDTLVIGENVSEITPCLIGFPMDKVGAQTVTNAGYSHSVYIDNRSTILKTIGNGAFARVILRNGASLFTDSLKYIAEAAFKESRGLSSLRLPEGCRTIGAQAFFGCQELDSVWLPLGLESVGSFAFYQDSALAYLHYDCNNLWIDNDWPEDCQPFGRTPSLRSIDFGPDVRYLTMGMFRNAEGLERLEFPEGLIEIGDECFLMSINCNRPDAERWPSSGIFSYNESMFVDSTSLHYVSLPSTLQRIGGGAFSQSCKHFGKNIVAHIDTVVCHSAVPPTIGSSAQTSNLVDNIWYISPNGVFEDTTYSSAVMIVPCGSLNAYRNHTQRVPVGTGDSYVYRGVTYYYDYYWDSVPALGKFQHIEEYYTYNIDLTVNVDTMGTATWMCASNDTITLVATPNDHHRFVRWSDGDTNNPRAILVTSDTTIQAEFAWGNIYHINVEAWPNSDYGEAYGSGDFVENSIDTLTAVPNYGYHFVQWEDGSTDNPHLLTVTRNWNPYYAIFEPNQYTIDLVCDTSVGTVWGAGTYNYNSVCSISAYPRYQYHFVSWNDGNTDNPRDILLTCDTTFTALFAINTYTLTAVPSDTTMGSVEGGGTYEYGTEVTLTAIANEGYHFVEWSDGSFANPHTVTVYGDDATYTALFEPYGYWVTANADDPTTGNVTGGDLYAYGSYVTLTANAAEGYHFVQWNDGNTDNPRTVRVTGDTTFTAFFEISYYTVTIESNSEYLGTVEGGGTYPYGTVITLTATAIEHFHFNDWGDGNNDNPRTVTVTNDAYYYAYFSADWYTVTVVANDPSWGSVAGGGDYEYDSHITLNAYAVPGHPFLRWNDGNTDNPRTIVVDEDVTYTAYFDPGENAGVSIAYVGVDASGHNSVCWEPREGSSPATYRIYREGLSANTFDRVGIVSATGASSYSWSDDQSNPAVRTYTYRLSEVAADGTESTWSSPHTTMHLQINQGQGNIWNLSWTAYIGFEYSTYRIYRGTSATDMSLLTTLPATSTTYSDLNEEGLNYYYQVEVVRETGSKSLVASSRSNIVTNTFEPRQYTLTVMSADITQGTVSGSGTYDEGYLATIQATPYEGYSFAQWHDGSTANPRTITVTADATYMAYFTRSTGIGDRTDDDIEIAVRNGKVTVCGAKGMMVTLSDVVGRVIYRSRHTDDIAIDVPASGVYLLYVEGRKARRIVVVK